MNLLQPDLRFSTPPAIQSWAGEMYFRFQHVMVQVCYAGRGMSLASPAPFEACAGELCEVSVWLRQDQAPKDHYTSGFPYSPQGFPLSFATNEQLAAVLHWASLLASQPPIHSAEKV